MQQTLINRLPLQMRLAPIGAAQIKPNAEKILLSKECTKGRYQFRTGIQKTNFDGWYLGNDFEYYRGEKIISLILIHFISNETAIELYYFHRYDKGNTFNRMHFAHQAIPHLLNKSNNKAA